MAGASDIFGTLSNLGSASPIDLLNTAIKGANLVRNAQSISGAGIKEEGSGLLTSVLGNISSSPAAVRNLDGTITTVPTSVRIEQGTAQATQQVSPAGINIPSISAAVSNVIKAGQINL
jgi:hypothetical protein